MFQTCLEMSTDSFLGNYYPKQRNLNFNSTDFSFMNKNLMELPKYFDENVRNSFFCS